MIKTKSVYSPIARSKDGLRILATRFRGGGVGLDLKAKKPTQRHPHCSSGESSVQPDKCRSRPLRQWCSRRGVPAPTERKGRLP
jgi:hypothetical protein